MPVFDYRFQVEASLEEVIQFHSRTDVLRRLTPPPLVAQVHRFGEMREGMVAEFTLWIGPIPIHWRALHCDVGRHGFTDVQQAGPAASWRHTHRFVPLGENLTELQEHIEYTHKPGWAGLATRLLFPKPGLRLLFAYRKWVTRRTLAGQRRGRRPSDRERAV